MTTGMEADFDSGNMRFKARERYSFGFSDPRAVFGSQEPNTNNCSEEGGFHAALFLLYSYLSLTVAWCG